MRGREAVGTQTILVGHHHQREACRLQFEQGRDHLGLERQLVEAVDLEVDRRLGDQSAIAVNEQDLVGHQLLLRR